MAISVQQAVLYGEELVARKEKRFAEAAARKRKVEMREKAKAIMNTKKVKKNIVAVTKKPQTVDECLLKLFDNVMQLKNAKLLHDNMCKAGKRNFIPIRYLVVPPSNGPLGREAKMLDSGDVFDSSLLDASVEGKTGKSNPEQNRIAVRKKLEILVFVYYASYGGSKEKSLSLSGFLKLIEDIKIIEDTALDETIVTKLFNTSMNKKSMLEGAVFPQLLNDIAFYAWPENKKKDALINQWKLHDNYINPKAGRAKSDPLTLTLLFNDKVNKVLSDFRWPLWCVYKHFRSLLDHDNDDDDQDSEDKDTDEEETIDWDEFSWLLTSFKIVGPETNQLSWEGAKKIFNQANVGELGDDDVDTLVWEEFVECLCRIALAMFPLENDESYTKFKSVPPTAGLKRAVKDVFEKRQSLEKDLPKKKRRSSSPPKISINRSKENSMSPRKFKEMKSNFGRRSVRRVAMFVFARKKKGYTQEEATADLDRILKTNPKYFSVVDAETIRAGIKAELQTAAERFGTIKGNIQTVTKLKFLGKKVGKKRRFGLLEDDAYISHSSYLASLQAMYKKAAAAPSLKNVRKILDLAFHNGTKLYGQTIHNGKDLFDAIDDDRDGKIKDDELIRALHRMNVGLKNDTINLLVEHIESKNGIIEYGHFLDAITQKEVLIGRTQRGTLPNDFASAPAKQAEKTMLRKKNKRARQSNNEILQLLKSAIRHKRSLYNHEINSIKDIFEAMDQDGSQFVEGHEIENAFKRLGFGLSDFSTQNFISHTDVDFDNKISFSEFEAVLLGKDVFSKLSKEQNHALKSPRVHIYEAAQIVAKYMKVNQDRNEIVGVFETYDHNNNGKLELQQFLGGLREICGLSDEDTRKVLYLIGGNDQTVSIDYLEFVHHLDRALNEIVLENQRANLNKTLDERKIEKRSAKKKVRNLWDLVYEPPDPKPIFDEDEMKGKHAYLKAMKIAPISLDSELAPNKSDDRDWSRVEVKKRINTLVDYDYNPPPNSPLNVTFKANTIREDNYRLPLSGPMMTGKENRAKPKKPSTEPMKNKPKAFRSRGRKMKTMDIFKRTTAEYTIKPKRGDGMPIPDPIFSPATHMKYDYSKAMKVPTLDLQSFQQTKRQYSSPSSKSARNWARPTIKERLKAVQKGSPLPLEISQSARSERWRCSTSTLY